jgi:hypothetical protein
MREGAPPSKSLSFRNPETFGILHVTHKMLVAIIRTKKHKIK